MSIMRWVALATILVTSLTLENSSAKDEFELCINKSNKVLTDEQRLYMVLMKDYDRNTRPIFNAAHPVNVSIGITLTQIFDLDERNQVLTTNIWLDQAWHDQKLVWDPAEYNGLTKMRIPCKTIWLPDIVLYNSAEDYTQGYMEALAMVSHEGEVFWPPIVKLKSTCSIDITYFPFDDQICKMKVGSWAYDGFQVDVFNTSDTIDLSNFVSNGEWELVNVSAVRNVVYYACCPEPFPDVTFTVHIRRRTLYYTYNVIVPCIMLSVLTLLGFWMRPDSGEKVTLGLTVLLAFSVFMLLIAENMPATSSFVPLIGIYLTTIMSLTSLSVIFAVMTSNINHRGYKEFDLPRFFRGFIVILSRLLWMKLHHITYHSPEAVKLDKMREHMKVGYSNMKTTFSNDSGCNLIDYDANVDSRIAQHNAQNNLAQSSPITSLPNNNRWELEEILRRLQILIQKDDDRENNEIVCKRWMEAAEVIDRFLFVIFVTGTLVSSVVLLFLYPAFKSVKMES